MNQVSIGKDLHISTMTAVARVEPGTYIVPPKDALAVFAQYIPPKTRCNKFNNQYTILIPPPAGVPGKGISCKVFRNGVVQLSGLRSYEDQFRVKDIFASVGYMSLEQFKIAMINTNYAINRPLNLYNTAIYFKQYGLHISFDPQRLRGVHVKYMYKEEGHQDGKCTCLQYGKEPGPSEKKEPDIIKKKRKKKCECIPITIMLFATGKIVITGAKDIKQTIEAYNFINQHLTLL